MSSCMATFPHIARLKNGFSTAILNQDHFPGGSPCQQEYIIKPSPDKHSAVPVSPDLRLSSKITAVFRIITTPGIRKSNLIYSSTMIWSSTIRPILRSMNFTVTGTMSRNPVPAWYQPPQTATGVSAKPDSNSIRTTSCIISAEVSLMKHINSSAVCCTICRIRPSASMRSKGRTAPTSTPLTACPEKILPNMYAPLHWMKVSHRSQYLRKFSPLILTNFRHCFTAVTVTAPQFPGRRCLTPPWISSSAKVKTWYWTIRE